MRMSVMRKFVLFLGAVLFFQLNAQGSNQLEKYQVNFIYNFTRQIQWPNLHNHTEFVIGVFGKNHPLTAELLKSVGDRKVGGRDIKIVEFSTVEGIGFCHMLFIPNSKTNQLKRISDFLSGSPVVLVTEVQGRQPAESVINLSIEDDKMGFRVNEESAKQRNLLVSSQLIQYSRK